MQSLAAFVAVASVASVASVLAPYAKKVAAKRFATKLQLVYFNLPGLGEPIRFLLHYLGVPFDDHRFQDRSEFMAMKQQLRFGQVPCLRDGKMELFQSAAIMRYIACTYDASGTLYPLDAALASQVDALLDQIKDMMTGWGPLRYRERFGFPSDLFTDESQAKCEAFFLTDTLPRHLAYFAKLVESDPSSPWLLGSSPTIADFMLATVVQNNFILKQWDTPVEIPPTVKALVETLYKLPAVVAFKAAESKL